MQETRLQTSRSSDTDRLEPHRTRDRTRPTTAKSTPAVVDDRRVADESLAGRTDYREAVAGAEGSPEPALRLVHQLPPQLASLSESDPFGFSRTPNCLLDRLKR